MAGAGDNLVKQYPPATHQFLEVPISLVVSTGPTDRTNLNRILDLGCGPGRDLSAFRDRGHEAVGLDGAKPFVDMAKAATGCEVLHKDFIALTLPEAAFDGIFANAALFHVPSQEIARVLGELNAALKPQGVLFCSNPRGDNQEGWLDGRYGCFHDLETWRDYVTGAGFTEVTHYYRPPGRPRHEQPWLATVWRKP